MVLEGKYRFDRLIAAGGMAEVWQGYALHLHRDIAIKRLHPHLLADRGLVERFQLEARLASKVQHDAIVKIYDRCSTEDTEAIVMELVRGRTLRQHLDQHGALDPGEAARFAAIVADVLQVAHQAGLVHRDIKPGNILLCEDGELKVADFGIAKATEGADLTQEGMMLGTAKYLAPEQVQGGPVDGRTDVYALGVVLYEMLTGRPPFVADTDAATALARLHRDPPRPRQVKASVPKALDDITMKAMARDPQGRYQTASAMRGDLVAAARGSGVDATVVTAPEPPPLHVPYAEHDDTLPPPAVEPAAPGERRWLLPALVVVLVLVALGVAGLLISQSLNESGFFEGDDGAGGGTSSSGTTEIPIADVITFDPEGDGQENDAGTDAGTDAAIDGDPASEWVTEGYDDPIQRLKPGVGIILNLAEPGALQQLQVTSGNTDWSAEVYVSTQPAPQELADWGPPVATGEGLGADATFELDGAEGSAVLLWLTGLGPRGDDGKLRGQVGEVAVTGQPG